MGDVFSCQSSSQPSSPAGSSCLVDAKQPGKTIGVCALDPNNPATTYWIPGGRQFKVENGAVTDESARTCGGLPARGDVPGDRIGNYPGAVAAGRPACIVNCKCPENMRVQAHANWNDGKNEVGFLRCAPWADGEYK